MLNKSLIQDIIGTVLKYGGDFAEVFVEKRYENKIELSDGFIQKANTNNISGIGIRGFLGNKAIYAYTNIFEKDNLLSVAKRVGEALSEIKVPDLKLNFDDQKIKNRHIVHFYPKDIDKTEKAKIMKKAYHAAKNFSELIKQVLVWYWEYDQEILVANSEGVWAEDRRVKTRLMINTVAEHNGNMERGFYGPGAGMGFEFLI